MLVMRCPRCQGLVERDRPRARGPYWQALLVALSYPIQPMAGAHVGGYAILYAVLSPFPFSGDEIAQALIVAYLSLVVRTSVLGQAEVPAAELPPDLGSYFKSVLQFTLALLVPFVPAYALWLASDAQKLTPAIAACVAVGIAYLPASVLLSAHDESLAGPFNVVSGVKLIARIPAAYALTAVAAAMVLVACTAFSAAVAATGLDRIPILGNAVSTAASLPFYMVAARMLGLLVFHHGPELGLED